jgi:polysaccharide pyruvyl transferase WcaK-like protein
LKIVIPEAIPSLNKGEMAIFEGIREALTVFGKPEITLYCAWLETDRQRYAKDVKTVGGIDLFQTAAFFSDNPPSSFSRRSYVKRWGKLVMYALLARLSKRVAALMIKDDFLQAFVNADLLMVGHDGTLNVELFWFVFAANILHIPIAIYGAGIVNYNEKLESVHHRKMFQYAFNHTIFNSVRDYCSAEFVLENGVSRERFSIFPDPAILMKPSPEQVIASLLARENIPNSKEIPLFGLIPVKGGVVFQHSFSLEKDKNKKNEMRVTFWAQLVMFLMKNTNAHFVFIPHCIGPAKRNDDRIAAKGIADKLSGFENRFTLVTNEYSAQDLKGLMGRCDFVLGERTHALLGALSFPTPCMALTVKEDLRMLGIVSTMFKRTTYNMNDPDISDLQMRLLRKWNNRHQIREEMKEIKAQAVEEAEKAARILKEQYDNFRKK